jgi:hypothetical protein
MWRQSHTEEMLAEPSIFESSFGFLVVAMTLSARQSETLRRIRDLEMSGQMRFIYAAEAQELCNLALVEKQPGIEPSYRLTAKGWKVLDLAVERLSLLVTL